MFRFIWWIACINSSVTLATAALDYPLSTPNAWFWWSGATLWLLNLVVFDKDAKRAAQSAS